VLLECGNLYQQGIANSQLIVIDEGGHSPLIEIRAIITLIISNFTTPYASGAEAACSIR
jgi:hypothetical protein